MKINVSNLKVEIKKLNKLIDEYEDTCLNLYNELASNQVYWNDDISKKFNENIMLEKIEVKETINECKKIPSPIKRILTDRLFYKCANNYKAAS